MEGTCPEEKETGAAAKLNRGGAGCLRVILELDQNLSKGFDRAKPVKFCMRRRSVPSHAASVRSTRVSR